MSQQPKPVRGRHELRRWRKSATLRILTPIPSPRRIGAGRWLAFVMFLSLAGCGRMAEKGSGTQPPPVVAGRVEVDDEAAVNIAGTPFTLTDQTGKEFSSAALAGKVWLGSIFFSNCPGPCFRENQAVAEILKEIADPDFVAVSLTCDPVNDTPDVLARYAERFEADAARWKFLTGDMQTISDVGLKTFRLPVEVGVHSERGVVFDRQGRLRGGYHLLQADRVELLKKLIRDVLAEPAPPGTKTP
jgi:protein SCO1/2